MKKLYIFIIITFLFFNIPIKVKATSGCCSHHGGVDCSQIQNNGTVVCNDGWTGSSCSYASMDKCSQNQTDTEEYYENEEETENNYNTYNDNNYEEDNGGMGILGYGAIAVGSYYILKAIRSNKKDN